MAAIGFIGGGNMGSALAKGVCKSVGGGQVMIADGLPGKAEQVAKELGCTAGDNRTIAQSCTTIFLAVKPQMMGDMLAEIAPILKGRTDRFVLVSMAAALTIETIRAMAGGDYPVIRIMPNTPAAVGEGMILCCGQGVDETEMQSFERMMSGAGKTDRLPEHLIDAATSISGCGPAFCCLFVEALADGAVACGLPRDKALAYAAQMMLGTAKLLQETGDHPGKLKDAVCSPGGTTIAGVRALEQGGFRSSLMEAAIATVEKSNALK